METANDPDRDGTIQGLIADPHDAVRRAAVSYLLACGPNPAALTRRLLDAEDAALRRHVVEELFERPYGAAAGLSPEWIEARLASESAEDRMLAALALGAMPGRAPVERLRALLADPDVEVRRAALRAIARRPSRELLDAVVPHLDVQELGYEAREAVAAMGDPAIPALQRLLEGEGDPRGQVAATRTLARMASPRALDALMPLVRGGDVGLRHLGLQALARARLHRGDPVLSRSEAHRAFLRELHEYRACLEPARALESHPAPDVRLLGESYRESAEMALERALQALACWYEPRPLFGVFERLKTQDLGAASPALEYLGHVLPRAVFRPVSRIFEHEAVNGGVPAADSARIAQWIDAAWQSDDSWLRACAVRASRHLGTPDPSRYTLDGTPEIVRAEITALTGATGRGLHDAPIAATLPRMEGAC